MKKILEGKRAITLVALVITIIVLLLLAGIAIASLGGENGIFAKVKQAKKMQLESEMKEQLTMGLQELQVAKKGMATLDDITQKWANEAILKDYNPMSKEDASLNGKLIVMTKDGIKGKFLINQDLSIETIEYNTSSVEVEYTTVSREDNKVKINIVVTDKVNGLKQIDYPEGNPLKVVDGVKEQISIDYEVELGQEYKFVIISGDGSKTEKIIKIDDYFYNVSKTIGEGASIDNTVTKTAYNKGYEATILTEENYIITDLKVIMDGQEVTTSGNNIVDINTGKIKIEKVTGNINIKVETKKLEIKYTAIAVSTSSSSSNTSSLEANTQTIGTTLYINIIATLEGNKCTVVLKSDNSKTVPYEVTTNSKYTFFVSGTYNGKTISEDKEVTVNQYQAQGGFVKYDAGDWTKEEIEQLENKRLYMINKEKDYNSVYNLNNKDQGLNFTFGGFTYKGDTTNENDISNGNIITSRNQSVQPQYGYGRPNGSGWKILNSEVKNKKIYITKIVHAGNPENFVYYGRSIKNNAYRAEYILSGGTSYNKLSDNKTIINPRDWNMYKDKILENNGYINNVHIMSYYEALSITSKKDRTESVRKTGSYYWLGTAASESGTVKDSIWYCGNDGYLTWSRQDIYSYSCLGIRPVVTMNDGVYIASGSGTESDPYILGKD